MAGATERRVRPSSSLFRRIRSDGHDGKKRGYENFRTIEGDAAKFGWSSIAPIGSLQAYQQFIAAHGLPFERAGMKGGVVRKRAGAS